MYKVSIIIPMYNVEKYLKMCLDSIANQTLKDIEVIAINDGSTDKTLEIVQKYKSILPNLTIISTKNYGAGHARNIGLEIAKGEYIKFLDADDEIPSNKTLETIYNVASIKEADVLIGKHYTHLGKIDVSKGYQTLGRNKSGFITDKDYPFKEMPGIGDKIFRKSHIGNIRFSETKWEDLAFTPVLMADASKLYFLDEIIYNYRMRFNNTSISGCLFANNVFDFFKVFDNLNENFAKRGIKDKYEKELLGLFSMHGHFDATYVSLWCNMSLKDKENLLKYFITKMETYYPDFRNDYIANEYYSSHKLFLKLFNIADNLAKRSRIEIEDLDAEIEEFTKNKQLSKKK